MLPPPAPIAVTSIASAFTTMSCSSSNDVLTNGAPPVTTLMSSDVPPTSAHSRFGSPIIAPKCALPIAPADGPENTTRYGCSIARRTGTSVAAQSAKFSSPPKPAAFRPRSSRSV